MRNQSLLLSALILVATTVSARAQSVTGPGFLFSNAPNPAPAASPFAHDYLVPHDSRNEVPRISLAAHLARQKRVVLARKDSVCYTARTYSFPTDGSPDMTKPTSSTTCEVPKEASLKRSTAPIPR